MSNPTVSENKVIARAPLRIGLAGGGTDVSPYCDVYGGCVLNATIDRYAYVTIEPGISGIEFRAADLDKSDNIDNGSEEAELVLHRAAYKYVVDQYNGGKEFPVRITSFCDAPVGSGLGTSSTLVVTMIKGLLAYLRVEITPEELSIAAFHVERVMCGLRGGRQDQYSASFGGFNFMDFHEGHRALVTPLRLPRRHVLHLESHLILCFTGLSRDSGNIISKQSAGVEVNNSKSIDSLHKIKREATLMKEALLRGHFQDLVGSLRDGWTAKKNSAAEVSNNLTDEIYDFAIQNGAAAGKLSGAGGGGFFLFYVETSRRADLVRALQKRNLHVGNVHFTEYGAEAWKY